MTGMGADPRGRGRRRGWAPWTRARREAPVARLRVGNDTEQPLELVLEPYGSDHWLAPGETSVVWTTGSAHGPNPWSGTTLGNEPFQVSCGPGWVVVHANGSEGWVADEDGDEIDCGHGRPATRRPPGMDTGA
ncbi:hypothetical protein [Streptomyces lichenis]|uniref:Uncharacterized protein n=1 Tax=Streptomyces lichenis TaxID=2306967 RepID=A0ABT0ICD5_9ACTN|nr:hypothetical protein [Streptomyces lichenis]MCK8678999.1 hypothetical protein [Streptomyces lichenis]